MPKLRYLDAIKTKICVATPYTLYGHYHFLDVMLS